MKNGGIKLVCVTILLLAGYVNRSVGQEIYRPPDPPHPISVLPADQTARAPLGLDQYSPSATNSSLVQSWAGMAQTATIRPPDPHGAAGPNGIMATVNLRIAYHTKAGAYTWGPVSLVGAAGFWGTVGNLSSSGNSDPRALYDPATGRFYVIMQEATTTNQSFLNLAVSKNSNPASSGTADWYFYRINNTETVGSTPYGGDYPGFGFDDKAVYVTFNMYGLPFSTGAFKNCQIIVLKKADIIAGTGTYWLLYTADGSSNAFTLQPATVLSTTTPGNKAYFASISFANNTTVIIWALADPLGTRTLTSTTVTVPNHGGYINDAPQAGTSTTVPTLSPRTQGNTFWYNGALWTCHTAGGGSGKSSVYYYNVSTNDYPTSAPTLSESGFIDGGSGVWTYQPSIGGNAFGDIALVYTESSTSLYPTIMYTSRASTGSSFDIPQQLKASPAYSNSDRWGDWASVTADPIDNSFWLTHEWARSTGAHDWGTWWGNLLIVRSLANHTPIISSAHPGYYSFNEPYGYWSVAGVRPSAGSDYDIELYSDAAYTSFLAASYQGSSDVDFVVVDHNHSPAGLYYPKVGLFTGTGSYAAEWEDSTEYLLMPGTYTTNVTWPAGSVVKVWDVWLQAGKQYLLTTGSVTGGVDLDMALFKSNGAAYYTGRFGAVRTSATPGNSYERLTYTAPADDWYGLVVWCNNASSGTFAINVNEVFLLASAVPQTRALNEATYRFDQQADYWSVVGVRPPAGDDYDLLLYGDSLYANYLASSSYGGSTVDFVVGDYNHSPLGLYYPMVSHWSGPGGNFAVEWEDNFDQLTIPGTTATVNWTTDNVVKAWDTFLSYGKTYKFVLTPVSGSVDVGIALFASATDTFYAGRGSANVSADAFGAGLGESFFYTPTHSDYYGFVVWANNAAIGSFKITVSVMTLANIKVLLEGPFNASTGLMNNPLRSSILPARFPGRPIPASAVDSIQVEIRGTATGAVSPMSADVIRVLPKEVFPARNETPELHVADDFSLLSNPKVSQPAWLLADGTIRNFFDTTKSYVEFDTTAGSYFVVIRHRNHLSIMTAAAQVLSGSAALYDFTTAQSQAYGTNPMKLVGTKYCMYAGDANASAIVTTADANGVFTALLASGYNPNDVNLSGVVSSADANIIFTNMLVGSQVPGAVQNPGEIISSVIGKSPAGNAKKDNR